ncbi:hypothetical protein HAX54_044249 [Datura stramonium]|uniref:Uncharacterized protein n=1 Tax=Datura stramonium TaxID=4076 RepID=A0ABS8SNZ0_DATST|nr:hypothetical protein [Datura stramonium]
MNIGFLSGCLEGATGWPLNNMEQQYKFLVKHVDTLGVAFHGTSLGGYTPSILLLPPSMPGTHSFVGS